MSGALAGKRGAEPVLRSATLISGAGINQRLCAVSGLMPHPGQTHPRPLVILLGPSGASPHQNAQDAALDRPIASLVRFLTRRSRIAGFDRFDVFHCSL
jgi:hypothetical protein